MYQGHSSCIRMKGALVDCSRLDIHGGMWDRRMNYFKSLLIPRDFNRKVVGLSIFIPLNADFLIRQRSNFAWIPCYAMIRWIFNLRRVKYEASSERQPVAQLDRKVTSQDCPTITSGTAVAVDLRSALSTVLRRALSLDTSDFICEIFTEYRRNRH